MLSSFFKVETINAKGWNRVGSTHLVMLAVLFSTSFSSCANHSRMIVNSESGHRLAEGEVLLVVIDWKTGYWPTIPEPSAYIEHPAHISGVLKYEPFMEMLSSSDWFIPFVYGQSTRRNFILIAHGHEMLYPWLLWDQREEYLLRQFPLLRKAGPAIGLSHPSRPQRVTVPRLGETYLYAHTLKPLSTSQQRLDNIESIRSIFGLQDGSKGVFPKMKDANRLRDFLAKEEAMLRGETSPDSRDKED